MKSNYLLVATLLTLLSSAVLAQNLKESNGMLVTATGMTVYTFDKDVANSGTSNCSGKCLDAWPAVIAKDNMVAAPYTVIKRDDGVMQLAYKGKPLYHYASDSKAGETAGDNYKDVWHIVKP